MTSVPGLYPDHTKILIHKAPSSLRVIKTCFSKLFSSSTALIPVLILLFPATLFSQGTRQTAIQCQASSPVQVTLTQSAHSYFILQTPIIERSTAMLGAKGTSGSVPGITFSCPLNICRPHSNERKTTLLTGSGAVSYPFFINPGLHLPGTGTLPGQIQRTPPGTGKLKI